MRRCLFVFVCLFNPVSDQTAFVFALQCGIIWAPVPACAVLFSPFFPPHANFCLLSHREIAIKMFFFPSIYSIRYLYRLANGYLISRLLFVSQKRFIKGLRQYGKNFFRIRKELLPNKETVSPFPLIVTFSPESFKQSHSCSRGFFLLFTIHDGHAENRSRRTWTSERNEILVAHRWTWCMDIRFNSKHIRLLDGLPRTVSTLCLQPKQNGDCLRSAAEEGALYITASGPITLQFCKVHYHLICPNVAALHEKKNLILTLTVYHLF